MQIQLRRGTALQWYNNNPVLAQGELVTEVDTNKFKIGDGTTAYNALPYVATPPNINLAISVAMGW